MKSSPGHLHLGNLPLQDNLLPGNLSVVKGAIDFRAPEFESRQGQSSKIFSISTHSLSDGYTTFTTPPGATHSVNCQPK